MSLIVHQANLEASQRLLQRMFPGDESRLPHLVFRTTQPPFPEAFQNPRDPSTKNLVEKLNINMVGTATVYTVGELQLNPAQVDLLQIQDPRIVRLKQNILDQISGMPIIQQLRADRCRVLNLLPN